MRITARDLLARNPCLSPEQIARYTAGWPDEGLTLCEVFDPERIAVKRSFIAREGLPEGVRSLDRLTREHFEWCAAELLPPEAFELGLRTLVQRGVVRYGSANRFVRAAAQHRARDGSNAKRLARVGAHLRAAGFRWEDQARIWWEIARELDDGSDAASLPSCAGS